ncbi:hypothetical protein GQ42DRAFT_179029 [Ramicandelaber brevisporus]|nr:hypothetical protein GQ42DRAFT_179029 [Ramicandelaber brevisporus]
MKLTTFAAVATAAAVATVSALPNPFPNWDNTALACAVNKYRAQYGKPALKIDPQLANVAQIHATEMAQNKRLTSEGFSDKTRTLDRRMKLYGRSYWRYAENIGYNYNWGQFMKVTTDMPSLRNNVLGDFNVIGLAWADPGTGGYISEMFAYTTDKAAFDKLPALVCKN